MTAYSEAEAPRPLRLNIDKFVRGALAVSAITSAAVIVMVEILFLLIAVNADNNALKALGIAHQYFAVCATIAISFLLDILVLPILFFAARAYLRSYWKMALFSSSIWAGTIAFTTYHWDSTPNTWDAVPGNAIATMLLGYLAVRWRRIKAEA